MTIEAGRYSGMSSQIIVSGAYACFRRPEFRSAAITHDVITPMAARRLFESVHWTPAIWWHIDRIEVLRAIHKVWLDAADPSDGTAPGRRQCLADVVYRISAHFELTRFAGLTDNAGKHRAIFKRALRAQRFFRPPTLGMPDLPAQLIDAHERTIEAAHHDGSRIDLGWSIYDRDENDRDCLRFYRPVMRAGIIDLTGIDRHALPTAPPTFDTRN